MGPHKWPMRVLLGGVKVWRRIKALGFLKKGQKSVNKGKESQLST
jgi:hypothetical protein